jgi:hypothetical protein
MIAFNGLCDLLAICPYYIEIALAQDTVSGLHLILVDILLTCTVECLLSFLHPSSLPATPSFPTF